MTIEKKVTKQGASIVSPEVLVQDENRPSYPSNSYQKILDYHVSEILLTTIIIGTIVLLRLHH